jgi:hypothetical protein
MLRRTGLPVLALLLLGAAPAPAQQPAGKVELKKLQAELDSTRSRVRALEARIKKAQGESSPALRTLPPDSTFLGGLHFPALERAAFKQLQALRDFVLRQIALALTESREYKAEQRQFRDVVTGLAQRVALEQVPSLEGFERARMAVQQKRKELEANRDTIASLRAEAARLQPRREKLDARYRNLKADLDSARSFHDLAVEEHGARSGQARKYAAEVARLQREVEDVRSERDAAAGQIRSLRARADGYEQGFLKALAELNCITRKFDAQVRPSIQRRWGLGDWVRNLPALDAFAAPVKIQQVTLTQLPIDYNFKSVTRFDRSQRLQWEYKVATFAEIRKLGRDDLTAGLNRLGGDGWELVGMDGSSRYVFKRPR